MNWIKYIYIGLCERIRYVWHYDVSKTCYNCEYLEDWGECYHCKLIDECFCGYYRPRKCKRVD